MINFNDVTKEHKRAQSWPQIPDYPDRILIIGGSGSEKTRLLFSLI